MREAWPLNAVLPLPLTPASAALAHRSSCSPVLRLDGVRLSASRRPPAPGRQHAASRVRNARTLWMVPCRMHEARLRHSLFASSGLGEFSFPPMSEIAETARGLLAIFQASLATHHDHLGRLLGSAPPPWPRPLSEATSAKAGSPSTTGTGSSGLASSRRIISTCRDPRGPARSQPEPSALPAHPSRGIPS